VSERARSLSIHAPKSIHAITCPQIPSNGDLWISPPRKQRPWSANRKMVDWRCLISSVSTSFVFQYSSSSVCVGGLLLIMEIGVGNWTTFVRAAVDSVLLLLDVLFIIIFGFVLVLSACAHSCPIALSSPHPSRSVCPGPSLQRCPLFAFYYYCTVEPSPVLPLSYYPPLLLFLSYPPDHCYCFGRFVGCAVCERVAEKVRSCRKHYLFVG